MIEIKVALTAAVVLFFCGLLANGCDPEDAPTPVVEVFAGLTVASLLALAWAAVSFIWTRLP